MPVKFIRSKFRNFWRVFLNKSLKIKLLLLAVFMLLLVLGGAVLTSALFAIPINEGVWWVWTHIMDPGFIADDAEDMVAKKLLGSFFAIMGMLVGIGTMAALLQDVAVKLMEEMNKGSVPDDISGYTVIAGKDLAKIRMVQNVLPDRPASDKILIIAPDQDLLGDLRQQLSQGSIVVARKIWINSASFGQQEKSSDNKISFYTAKRLIILEDFGGDIGDMLKTISEVYDTIENRSENQNALEIYAEVNNRELAATLRLAINKIDRSCNKINLHILNIADTSARLALRNNPLDCESIPPGSDKKVHLVIEGWTPFAQALFWQALRVAHYPSKPTHIVVCHPEAHRIGSEISVSAPGLAAQWCREHLVNLSFKEVFNPTDWNLGSQDLVTCAICAEKTDDGFAKALKLESIPFAGLKQVFLEVPQGSGYRDIIGKMARHGGNDESAPSIKFVAVGLEEKSIDLEEKLDSLAAEIHDHYSKKYGDVAWGHLDEIKRAWNRSPADHLDVKLRLLRSMINEQNSSSEIQCNTDLLTIVGRLSAYLEENDKELSLFVEQLSRIEHDRWCAEKYAEGWIYADKKNPVKKENPCLVPYDALPEKEQLKDWETMKIVLADVVCNHKNYEL